MKRFPLFHRYLLSYMLLLFLPIIVIGAVAYTHFVSILQDQVLSTNRKALQEAQQAVDTKMSEITKISAHVSMTRELSPRELQRPYDLFEVRELFNYSVANTFISDILLYFQGSSFLYSYNSSYSLPIFHTLFNYSSWSPEELQKDLDTLRKPTLRPAEDVLVGSDNKVSRRLITYLVPLPVNSSKPHGAVMYMIDESALQDLIAATIPYRKGVSFIIDDRDRVVTSLSGEPSLQETGFLRTIPLSEDGETIRTALGDTPYYVSALRSPVTGWTYVTAIAEEELLQPVAEVRNRALWTTAAVLIIGSLLIYAAMHLNYNPVQAMVRRMSSQLEGSQQAMRQQLLMRVLRGDVHGEKEFNEKGAALGLQLNKPYYTVLLLQLEQQEEPTHIASATELKQQAAARWLSLLPGDITAYDVEGTEPATVVMIAGMEEAAPNSLWQELYSAYSEKNDIPLTVGIGYAYRDLTELSKSFLEATTALQYKSIKGARQMIFFQEIDTAAASSQSYPKAQLDVLEQALRQRNADKSMVAAAALMQTMKAECRTLLAAKYYCFDIVHLFSRAMTDAVPSAVAYDYPDVLSLTRNNTLEELEQSVLRMCRDVCAQMEQLQQQEEEGAKPLEQLMLDYIHQQYNDYQFSVKQMAEHFSVSTVYLGKYFKEKTGSTVLEYTNKLRIEKAKDILRTTDIPLQDIVNQVGYSDVSSFIRKFKQLVSMTPGEYRKLYRSG
ncbi:helix-turn-helix domain-containing protein [Paenibacillus sp. F411]|uniref:helix-turn-helix domain-containing protein n=1 Tax=Paenibacillus sp. F411 TaxID=2820239 RepID=UPI001AAE5575|nr:helix-turn-helix domain-containing protein [Paenibacillus sp. F411]MBO2944391.1 helix-turn-helix domain-containing protein [Paenibacillus sp. F411]